MTRSVSVPRGMQPRPRSPVLGIWSFSGLSSQQIGARAAFFGIVFSALVVSVISVANAVRMVGKTFPGFLVNARMVVENSRQYHWTGAALQYPDKVLAANGRALSSTKELEQVIGESRVGENVRYSVETAGRVIEMTVATMRFTWADLLVVFGTTFVAGIIYLLVGVVVFIMKPDAAASWALLLACFFLTTYTISTFDVVSTYSALIRVYFFANTFFPAAFLHLSVVFPQKMGLIQRYPYLQWGPYVVSATMLVPYEWFYPRPAFLVFARLARVYAIVAAVTMLASTLRAYFGSSSVIARQRAKVVLVGAALAFPVPAFAYYMVFLGGTVGGVRIINNFLAIPIVIFPVSIAYAIAKHNLFDVDVYIKRAVGYGIMTAVVGMGYFSMQTIMSTFVLGPLFGEYRETIYPIVFALVVVFLFNPVNKKVQEGVDKIFFRKQFDYKQTISAVSSALTSMLNLDQIVNQIVYTIRKEMFVDTAGVIVLEPQKKVRQALFLSDAPRPGREELREIPIGYDDPVLALVRNDKMLITKYDIEEDPRYGDVKEVCLRRFSEMAASVAIPLIYQGEVTGVLALGNKKSGHFYSREDIDLLNTMADQAAVAIQNATTHQEVVRYAEELEASLRRIQILESIKTNLAKFVPKKVHELIEQSPEAPLLEKREADVSVLFADMTGYTRLSAQMELDQVNRLVERYFGAFLDEILREGGDVNETAGDGLMVIFQDPDPRRHARAAALAALGIQRRTREINAQLRGQSEPITMKVGLNSGIASVGATKIEGAAGTRWTYTASGPTTNVAARLAALGEGGGIVLSEETRRRLGDEFQMEDLGLQSLKNVAQPVPAYRLRGEEQKPLDARVRGAAREEGIAQ